MPNTRLTKQQVTATDRKKFTFSFWFKRGMDLGETEFIYESINDSPNRFYIDLLEPSDTLEIINKNSGSNVLLLRTTQVFRDASAWYHLVLAVDTDQSTAADRNKLYINGERITSFSTETNFSSGVTGAIGTSSFYHTIGGYSGGGAYYAGSMSFFALVDGTQELPTIFGETDSTTGQWKIKANITPSSGWGDNGFLILKNGNSLTDESTNSNNFALATGTLTSTKDCPDNVFATMNPLDQNTNVVLTNGNNSLSTTNNGNWVNASRATLGIGSGKIYWEMKITGSGNSNGYFFGICADTVNLNTSSGLQDTSAERGKGMLLFCDDGQYQLDNNSRQSMTTGAALNDVLGCAVDRDNNNVKFYKNGAQVGSIDISSSPLATVSDIMPLTIGYYTALQLNHNFGNGVFGTSTVSSEGTSASTPGTFEHDVPSGYQPLSTKGLNA